MTDILLNIPNRKAITLGEKWDEMPLEGGGGREILYAKAEPNFIAESMGFWLNWTYRVLMSRLVDTFYVSTENTSVDNKIAVSIHDYTCPSCGTPDEIRLLVGGTVDNTNPHAPILAFGNWDGMLKESSHMLKSLDMLNILCEKQKVRIGQLQGLEKENDILRADLAEKNSHIVQLNTILEDSRSENNRLATEIGIVQTWMDAKKHMSPERMMEMKNMAEAQALGDERLRKQEELLEARRRQITETEREVNKSQDDMDRMKMELDELRRNASGRTDRRRRVAGEYDPETGEPIYRR